MTDRELALVLPTDTDTEVELLGEDVETARGGIQAGGFSRFLRCRRSSLLANQFSAPVVVLGPFGETAATAAEVAGPFLVPAVARGGAVVGRAAAGAAERTLFRGAIALQNASFGQGVKAGAAAKAVGLPTPVAFNNNQFNAGAKVGAAAVDFGKAVVDTLD